MHTLTHVPALTQAHSRTHTHALTHPRTRSRTHAQALEFCEDELLRTAVPDAVRENDAITENAM
eukprot:5324210-Pleurochrysis_carterae.AAC.1